MLFQFTLVISTTRPHLPPWSSAPVTVLKQDNAASASQLAQQRSSTGKLSFNCFLYKNSSAGAGHVIISLKSEMPTQFKLYVPFAANS